MPLDPLVQRMIHSAYRQGQANLHLKSLTQIRTYFQRFTRMSPYKGYQDYKVAQGVTIRLHRINATEQLPLLIYLRPNAYVLGGINDGDLLCYYLAKYLKCIVAAIETRLAPEVKFPGPFTDALACIHHLINFHRQFNIDLKKTAIWGESSGANLAAAICARLKKEKCEIIKSQVLFYPMLDYSQQQHFASKALYGQGFMLDNDLSDWFLKQYVASDIDYHHESVSPLLADSFEKLPTTLVIGAQYDPMRDEAASYVKKLADSNVKVQSLFMPGLTHGFLWYSNRVPLARYPLYYAADFLKAQFIA